VVRVKLIFKIAIFRMGLLSTASRANSLGGRQHQAACGFSPIIAGIRGVWQTPDIDNSVG